MKGKRTDFNRDKEGKTKIPNARQDQQYYIYYIYYIYLILYIKYNVCIYRTCYWYQQY